MATCKDCFHYDACKGILDAVGIEMDAECPNQENLCGNFMSRNITKNTTTNADRIRAMNDEELEELLQDAYNAGSDDAEAWHFGEGHRYSFGWDLKWLQSPAEKEGE